MQSRLAHVGEGYSKKKKRQRGEKVSKSLEGPGFVYELSAKEKFPKVSSPGPRATEQPNKIMKMNKGIKVLLTRPIELRSKDYENAIKAHLGIQRLSKDSSFSSIFQKPTIKDPNTFKAKDPKTPKPTHLPQISLNSKRPNRPSQLSTKKLAKSFSISDEKDKEIEILQSSLNKINLLLKKLLHKPFKN